MNDRIEKFGNPQRPPRLKHGDVIGIAAPSSPFDSELMARGTAVLKNLGFQVIIPPVIYQKDGYHAGSDTQRAEAVVQLVSDPSIRAVFCVRGGFGAMKILPWINFDRIRWARKIFIGFSDVSALLSTLYGRCGWVTFHGPMVTSLADASDETVASLMTALTSSAPVCMKAHCPVVGIPGRAVGPVTGGNLTTLCHLVGTPYAPRFRGHILFLEERGEALYRIDRMLNQMKMAGCMDGVMGVALGRFDGCGAIKTVVEMLKTVLDDDGIPIVSGFDIGHGDPNLTVPIGMNATLETDAAMLLFHEPATEGD